MAEKLVMIDKAELVLFVPTKDGMTSFNLAASNIVRIQYDKCVETSFFGLVKKDSEKITIVTPKRPTPIEYYKSKNAQYFDEYKAELEAYAKANRVTFTDNTK